MEGIKKEPTPAKGLAHRIDKQDRRDPVSINIGTSKVVSNSGVKDQERQYSICKQNARRDGENMAACLKTMTSGMSVFSRAFDHLEIRYYPDWCSIFKNSFHGGIGNDSI